MTAGEFFLDHDRIAPLWQRIARIILVLAGGGLLSWISIEELRKARRLSGWLSVPCEIIGSDVNSLGSGYRETPYHVQITYRFLAGKQAWSKTEDPVGTGLDEAAEAYSTSRQYPPGSKSICYIDPAGSDETSLRRSSLIDAELFTVAAVLIDVILVFYYCIPQAFFYQKRLRRRSNNRYKTGIAVFSAIGLLLWCGSIFTYWYILPLAEEIRSFHWTPVQATVVEANVLKIVNAGEITFTVYKTDIHYRYTFNGITHDSNCYNLTEGATVFGSVRSRFVRIFQPGQRIVCFVNPADPDSAVLSRSVSPAFFNCIWAGWPIPLALAGLFSLGNEDVVMSRMKTLMIPLIFLGMAMIGAAIWGQLAFP